MSFMSWHSLPRTLQGFNAVIHFCASAPIGTRYTVQFSAIISWISLGIPHPWINFPNKLWNSLYSIYTYTCIWTSKSTELYTLDPFIIDHFLKKNWRSRIKMIAQQLIIDCRGEGGGVEFLRKFGTSVESQIIYVFCGFVQHPSWISFEDLSLIQSL